MRNGELDLRGVETGDGSFEVESYQNADAGTELDQGSAEKLRRAVTLAGFRIFHQQIHSNI
jgi:hypothetical protein